MNIGEPREIVNVPVPEPLQAPVPSPATPQPSVPVSPVKPSEPVPA